MTKIEEKDQDNLEKQSFGDKKTEKERVVKESHDRTVSLAEKILLQPIQKGLEALKGLVLPEKTKKEAQENVSVLERKKHQEQKDILGTSKKQLTQFQQGIIPSVYREYAEKGLVEAAKAKSAGGLITEISAGIHNPNPIARWAAQGLNRITRYT